jgi:hypothetical protein
MKLNATLFLVMAAVAAPSLALAESPGGSDICGLGWQVTQKKSFLATSTRSTTNVFVPPTFGMTSGTIGCSQHSIAKRDESAAIYAVTNYEPLKMELAEGRGEYVEGFARTLGCSDQVVPDFGKAIQGKYKGLNDSTGIELFDEIKAEIRQNPVLAANCRA